MADKKKNIGDAENSDLEKPFGTEFFGFKKSEVNLYINNQKKKIAKLEAMLEKAHDALKQAEYRSNADYEAQIIELREQLRAAKASGAVSHEEMLEVMPEASLPDAVSDEFKDMVI